MALNTLKCNYLTPLHFKGLSECGCVSKACARELSRWYETRIISDFLSTWVVWITATITMVCDLRLIEECISNIGACFICAVISRYEWYKLPIGEDDVCVGIYMCNVLVCEFFVCKLCCLNVSLEQSSEDGRSDYVSCTTSANIFW